MGPWQWPLLWCFFTALVHGTILAGGQRSPERTPQLAGWSPSPSSSWSPTPEPGASGDPEGSAAALAFLQTGDAQRLALANCSRGVAAGAAGPGPPPALRAALRAAPEALAHAANFLNMLFQTNDIREASVAEDVEWYQALVRSLAEGHPWVRRAVLALDAHPLAAKPRLMLQATKGDGEILLQDVSAAAPSLGNLSWDNEWFNALKSQRTPLLRKRLLSNDLRSMETPKWQRGDSYVGEPGHVRWSPPFLECRDGRFLPAWAVTLSSAFYGLKPDLSPEFKGVVRVDIELRDVAIDQCASGPGWFADTHRCDLNSTQCVPQESRGFVLGRYLCRCKPGFYGAGGVASGARAGAAGSAAGADGGSRLGCQPCRRGCATCEDDAPCLIQEDRALRAAVLSCQACCMLAVFLSMLVSYHFRRSKRIRVSGVLLLETILFGSLLLYFPVFILYFKPSIFRCIVLRWVRTLGFAIVYGTITLKLYRVLKVFLSRTAQRAPYVSSGRVLKMLGLILLLVLWFLAAWTVGMLENVEKNIPLVIRAQTARGLHFYICGHDRWDYMMVIAEMLFLLWGSFLCYATRAVPSAFHEPRYMGIALHNELMISAAFHVARFVMVPSLHPDWTLLLFFAHTHGTITMTLALLFIPKFLHAGSPLREEIAAEVYEDELDMGRSGSCLNSSIASAWSEHSLDPDDIREELKKLYRQLEVHKTRRMAANNPHLAKKRSSRRSLGRSVVRRVTEPPEAVTRRGSGSGERAGTPARRTSSAKLLPDAGGPSLRTRDEGSRRRAAALHRSRSIEGPPREPPGGSPAPGSPSPGRKTMAATASEHSDSESLDAAPLVCKSASAHNLGGHGQPPPPRAAPLLKSLSVVAGSREEALLAASRAAREKCHAKRHPPAPSSEPPKGAGEPQSPGAADATPPAGSSPAEGWPQEDVSPPGDGKVQKRVTYAPIKSVSVDGSHLPGRVRVAVRKTPPPPPIRYQSLVRRATPAGDSPEPAQPPADPPARAAEPEGTQEGTAEAEPERASPRAGKGRLLPAASIAAQVCPWELIQDEILSQKQKATEAAESGTPGDAAATPPPSLKPPPQKTSLRGLGLAIKAFNRSKGKSILKGKRESEGSLGKRGGSRRERPSLAETSAVSLGAIGQDPAAKSPEWSRQRPGSEPPARPRQQGTVPCQHNNNASSAWGAAGRGDGREEAEGEWDSPAPGTGDSETLAEEPSAPQGDVDAGGGSGVHEIPPSVGHPEGAEHPPETPAVASSGKAQVRPQRGDEVPAAEPGKDAPAVEPGQDAPAATVRLMAPTEGVGGLAEGLEVGSGSIRPRDHAEGQQPSPKPIAGSPRPSAAGAQRAAAERPGAEVCPQGAPRVPAGKAALLRQEAVAPQEDGGVPRGRESPAEALGKGDSRPAPPWSGGTQRVPAKSQSAAAVPAAAGKARSAAAEVCPGETRADSRIKIEVCPWEESGSEHWGPGRAPGKGGSKGDGGHPGEEPGTEKAPAKSPELPKAASERAGSAESRTAEVCPWESGEGGRSVRAEICPWDTEGAAPEREGQEGERRWLGKWVRSTRPKPLGLLRAQESGSSPQAPARPWSSTGSEGPPPKPAPRSSELPEVASKSPASPRASVCPWEVAGADSGADVSPWERGTALSDAGKLADGEVSQVKNGIPPQRTAPRGTRDAAPAADTGSDQRGSPSPGEGAEEPGIGLPAKHPALPKTSPKQAGTINSKKANVCPWEEEDEPLPKTEICPWEEPVAPSGKERPRQDTRGTSKGENKPGLGELEDIKAKLAEAGGRRPERRDSRIFAKFVRKTLERSKAEFKKSQSTESIKEEVCPWESLGTEQPPEKPRARSSALPKSPSNKSQSVESLKAEVCPWEAQEMESTDKAEICPWEAAAPPPGREKSRQDKDGPFTVSKGPSKSQIAHKEIGESTSGDKEKSRGERESICPWESTDTEGTSTGYGTRSPELLKGTTKKSESTGRTKAEVCPWESQELESTDKAEICPWEVSAPPPGKEKSRQDKDGWSIGSRSPSTGQGLYKEIGESTSGDKEKSRGESTSGDKEKSRGDRESICPWESTDTEGTSTGYGTRSPEPLKGTTKKSESTGRTKAEVCPWESLGTEQPPEKPRARSPALPKLPSNKSQSVESLKAEVCPWESQELESTDKAEICPWEAAAPSPGKEKSRQDKEGWSIGSRSPSTGQGLYKEIGESTSGDKEKSRGERESICPWESTDTEGTSTGYSTRSPELLKGTMKKSESTGRTKAEVCPWESQELESTDKAEICPWETAAPPPTKEKSRQDKDGPFTVSKGPSKSQVAHKEIGESTSGDKEKSRGERESICPWESTDTEGTSTGYGTRSPELPKGTTKKSESTGRTKAEVCPWESLGTEQPPEKPRARSSALPKLPSNKSQSVESLKAEVCPWESQGLESTDKAEICPWEAAAPPPGREKSRQDKDGPFTVSKGPSKSQVAHKEIGESTSGDKEKSRGERESICPWESTDTEGTSTGYGTRSPELLKGTTKKSESTGRTKVEVCPWESQELESTDKAEICPWEVSAPPPGKEKSRQDKDGWSIGSRSPSTGQGLYKEIGESTSGDKEKSRGESTSGDKEKSRGERESICPWESTDTEGTSTGYGKKSPELLKGTTKKSESTGRTKAEVCPWESQELESTDKAEICPWEAAAPPPTKEKSRQDKDGPFTVSKGPSKSQVAHKEIGESTSGDKEKSRGERESICPWESTDTEGTSTGYGTRSPEPLKGTTKKSESTGRTKAEVCPWESLGTEQPPEKPRARSPALPKLPSNKSQSVESLKAEVCPWESQELESTDKAEICPWEAAAPPPGREQSRQDKDAWSIGSRSPSTGQGLYKEIGESTSGDKEKSRGERESICPWESTDTEGTSTGYGKKSPEPLKGTTKMSESTGRTKAEVCPWESLGTEQPPEKPRTRSSALPKLPSNKSQSVESLKAEVCPWESQGLESTDKAEICPWEAAAPPPGREKSRQDKDGPFTVSKGPSKSQIAHKEIGESTSGDKEKSRGESTSGDKEKSRGERESICPWESTDTEGTSTGYGTRSPEPLKGTTKKSESTGRTKAEVCPWESLGTEQPPEKPRASSPALPKLPSNKSQSVESLKAEVCPWESQGLESTDKAEICPWEGLGTEEPSLKTVMGKEPSTKSESTEGRKSDICPWEAAEPAGSEKETFKPGAHPRGADRASPPATGTSQPVAGASATSPTALPKQSKGRSVGTAEHKPLCRILPGIQPPRAPRAERGASSAPAGASSPSPGTGIAEVCPWEAEEAPSASGESGTDTRKISEVCPWEVESTDPSPTLRRQGRAGASPQGRDRAANPSETKREVCPWDEE